MLVEVGRRVDLEVEEEVATAATLQSGVIVNVRRCDSAWCLVDGDGFKGYIEQEKLWGVYPDEKIE